MNSKIRFSFIGAGNIAHSLVPALINSNYKVDSIISRNIISAKNLAEQNQVYHYSDSIPDISRESDYYILSVNDDEILNLANEISELNLNFDFDSKKFIHLSGSRNIEILKPIENKGGSTASVHFMKSFPNHNIFSFKKCFAAVETINENLFEEIKNILENLKAVPFRISSADKSFYHLMGIFSLNFISANFFNSEEISEKIQDKIPPVSELFNQSGKQVIDNYYNEKNLYKSLSGPIKRGEIKTIKSHLEILENLGNHTLYLSYISNSLAILKLIMNEKEFLAKNHFEIKKLLLNHLKKVNQEKL